MTEKPFKDCCCCVLLSEYLQIDNSNECENSWLELQIVLYILWKVFFTVEWRQVWHKNYTHVTFSRSKPDEEKHRHSHRSHSNIESFENKEIMIFKIFLKRLCFSNIHSDIKFWQKHCNVKTPTNLTPWWDSSPGSYALEANAMTTMPRRQGSKKKW
jgi:hypothetical protein